MVSRLNGFLPAENGTVFLQGTIRVMRRRALLYENIFQTQIPVYFWVLSSATLHCLDSFV